MALCEVQSERYPEEDLHCREIRLRSGTLLDELVGNGSMWTQSTAAKSCNRGKTWPNRLPDPKSDRSGRRCGT